MAQPSNTYSQYDANNIREDLENIIYDISPMDTPFVSAISRRKITAIRHEWLTDVLAAASTSNAVIEGDEATMDAATATTRVSNIAQILDKTVTVTGTHRAVNSAGYKDALAYQIQKKGRELRRDIEATVLFNQASVLGDDTTARKLGGLASWLTSNTSRGTGGADGGYAATTSLTVAATNATAGDMRTFTESRNVFLVDPEYAALGVLRPMQQWELAKTGDTEKRQMLTEVTLIVENEAAHAVVADLLTA